MAKALTKFVLDELARARLQRFDAALFVIPTQEHGKCDKSSLPHSRVSNLNSFSLEEKTAIQSGRKPAVRATIVA